MKFTSRIIFREQGRAETRNKNPNGGGFVFPAINQVGLLVGLAPNRMTAYWLWNHPIQSDPIDVDVYHIIMAAVKS